MKSLKELALNVPEQDYHDYPAWSHSLIADYARNGFSAIPTIHDKKSPTPSMEFGSLFDSILTRGKDTFDEYVVDDTSQSIPPAEKEVFDKLLALKYGNHSFDELAANGTLQEVMHTCDSFCSKYKKEDTRYAKLNDCKDYYELRRTGKKIVSRNDWNDAVEMRDVFRNDPYLKDLFGVKNTKDKEYLYQLQLVTNYHLTFDRDVKVKIMLDLLIVDHKNKTLQPVDLKTSSVPGFEFSKNFLQFRYDLQASMYTDVLADVISKTEEYKDYTILPFLFTDISRTDKVPVTYEYDPHDPSQEDGFCYESNGKIYKHKTWQALLDEIINYEETHAKVPSYISTTKPNNLLMILNK